APDGGPPGRHAAAPGGGARTGAAAGGPGRVAQGRPRRRRAARRQLPGAARRDRRHRRRGGQRSERAGAGAGGPGAPQPRRRAPRRARPRQPHAPRGARGRGGLHPRGPPHRGGGRQHERAGEPGAQAGARPGLRARRAHRLAQGRGVRREGRRALRHPHPQPAHRGAHPVGRQRAEDRAGARALRQAAPGGGLAPHLRPRRGQRHPDPRAPAGAAQARRGGGGDQRGPRRARHARRPCAGAVRRPRGGLAHRRRGRQPRGRPAPGPADGRERGGVSRASLRWVPRLATPAWLLVAVSAGAFLVALLVALGIFAAYGLNPLEAGATIVRRTLMDGRGFGEVVRKSIPLLLAGAGMALALRARFWNIGAEGQILAGAVGASAVALFVPVGWYTIPALYLAGFVAAALYGLVPAYLKARLGVNEIITTLMFNYVAIYTVRWLINGPWRGRSVTGFSYSDRFARETYLPLWEGTRVHLPTLVIGVLLALLITWLLYHTRLGFSIRVMGDGPEAARYAGIKLLPTTLAL